MSTKLALASDLSDLFDQYRPCRQNTPTEYERRSLAGDCGFETTPKHSEGFPADSERTGHLTYATQSQTAYVKTICVRCRSRGTV